MSSNVKVIDRGWNKFKKEWERLTTTMYVDVGIQGDEADEDHDGIKNVQVAAAHEFGFENHPPKRSFLRSTFDENQKEIIEEIANNVSKMMLGKMDEVKAFGRPAERFIGMIKRKIRAGIKPKLRPSTLAARLRKTRGKKLKAIKEGSAKQQATPLIDTGQMINSITWALIERGNKEIAKKNPGETAYKASLARRGKK